MTAKEPRKSNGITFADWLKLVDARLIRRVGLGHDDLPDYLWIDAYDDDATPGDTVTNYLEEQFGD